jgi:triacylglycerol lipase
VLVLPAGDLGTDFAAAGVGAKFPLGFIRALAEIWDSVYEAVDAERKKGDRPVWIAGHSLGGALALLGGWRFKRKFVPIPVPSSVHYPRFSNTSTHWRYEAAICATAVSRGIFLAR